MNTIGVTGGTGFIGRYCVRELLNRGYQPLVLDRHVRPGSPEVEVFLGDVTSSTAVNDFAAQVDGIIHLAAVLGTQETVDNPLPAATSNLLGGLNFLEACVRYDLPAVYITVGNWWMDNPYSITKNMIERFVHMYNTDRGARVNVVRAVNAYGPEQPAARPFAPGKVRKITPALVCRALSGMPMELYGGGTQISDMVYVADVAHALVLALECASDCRLVETVEVGSPNPVTVREVADLVNSICAEKGRGPVSITSLPMRPGEVAGDSVSADTRTLAAIGFDVDSLVPLCIGLERTVDYFIQSEGVAWHSPNKANHVSFPPG